jgi:hypothetical protein
VLITSRSFAEYEAMFDLYAGLPKSVLDCCAGGSGFVAEACAQGVDAVAADPAYEEADLSDAVRTSLETGSGIVDENPDRFVWHWYGSRERRDEMRAKAAEAFLADRRRHPERYVAAALPRLPFGDDRFEMSLVSHLLFTWSDRFDADWHFAALQELARVTRDEVRVFPLVVQGAGEPVPFLDSVRRRLAELGLISEIRRVPYEFQRDADRMMVIICDRSVCADSTAGQ